MYVIILLYIHIGQLFFGNATLFASELEKFLGDCDPLDVLYIILDFTLVLAIDSSAAETVSSI